jgi:hypothetical protein
VKCDRIRPECTQCSKSRKKCTYVDEEVRKVEFVNENPIPSTGSGSDTPPLLDTWGSVIERQVEIIKKANDGNNEVPVWAVAEAEEVSSTRHSTRDRNLTSIQPSRAQVLRQLKAPLAHVIHLSNLGEPFALTVTNQMPSRETCQPFLENFIHSIHPIVPLCDTLTLRQLYDEFWATLSPSYSVEALALIVSVLYTGAANSTVIDVQSCSTLLRFFDKIFGTIDFAGYHARNIEASMQILQSYIIMNTFKASHLAPYSAFGFLPETIRFAQSLRLHVDKKPGDPRDRELRRRIWWHLLFLDVESTIATGLPPIIHRPGYTTQLPSLFPDDTIPALMNSPQTARQISPIYIAIQGHYQWANEMQTWFEALPSQDEVSKFKAKIHNLLELIPDTDDPDNEWARIYLKMQIDRAYCMLGLRFWQLDQYKGTGCQSEVVQ